MRQDERRDEEQRQQQERMLRRSQSAVDLRSMATGGLPRHGSTGDLQSQRQYMVELTTPEGHVYTAGRLSNEERAHKILRSVLPLVGRPQIASYMAVHIVYVYVVYTTD